MADESAVFAALGDPTRRRVLELLRGGELTVSDLTGALPVSQSAVSQHLKVLEGAGLVRHRAAGRRRFYRVERDGFGAVRAFADQFWDDVLDAFAAHADRFDRPDQPDQPDRPDQRRPS